MDVNGFLFSKDWKMFYFTNIINELFVTKFPYFFPSILFLFHQMKRGLSFVVVVVVNDFYFVE